MFNQKSAYIDANPVIVASRHKIVLAKRIRSAVEGGSWHLPGGRVLVNETFEMTLKRVSVLKTNLQVGLFFPSLKDSLVDISDNPTRDPRAHVIGIAFFCKILWGDPKPGHNVEEVKSFSQSETENLKIGFDHEKLVKKAFEMLEDLNVLQ